MSLKKTPTYIALLDFLRSYKSIEQILKRLFSESRGSDGLRDFIGYNNPTEHFLHLEDGFDSLEHNYKKDFIKICQFFASTHYKLGEKHHIFIRKNYLEELKVVQSSLDEFLIEGFFIYSKFIHYDKYEGLRFVHQSIYHEKFTKNSIVHQLESLSDLHSHLSSNMKIEYRIHEMLSYPSRVNTKKLPLDVFVQLNADMCIEDLFFVLSTLEQILIDSVIHPRDLSTHNCTNISVFLELLFSKKYLIIRDLSNDFFQIRQDKHLRIDDSLLKEAYAHFLKGEIIYGDRYLILFFIELLHKSKNRYIRKGIEIYFILRNILKSILVQQHRQAGFGYFSTYSGSSLKRAKKLSEKSDIVHSMINLSEQLNKPIYYRSKNYTQ